MDFGGREPPGVDLCVLEPPKLVLDILGPPKLDSGSILAIWRVLGLELRVLLHPRLDFGVLELPGLDLGVRESWARCKVELWGLAVGLRITRFGGGFPKQRPEAPPRADGAKRRP